MELNRNQNAIVWLILSMAMGVNALRNHISGNTPLLNYNWGNLGYLPRGFYLPIHSVNLK